MIDFQQVAKVYQQGSDPVRAVDNVTFSVAPGEFAAIMGPSGCGKSTLLQLSGCLDLPTSGEVVINGHSTSRLSDDQLTLIRRSQIGFVFQFFNLLPTLSALENVAMPLIINGWSNQKAEARARELLRMVGLEQRAGHKPSQLSGGQMQRVAIARALVSDPPIILGDEPTGNLDSANGQQIMELLRTLAKQQGRTVLIVTHDPRVAEVSDRVLVMQDGRVTGQNQRPVGQGA